MALMYSFCFYCSLRLGAIVIGGSSLLQALLLTILFSYGLDDPPNVSAQIEEWKKYDLMFAANLFDSIRDDPDGNLAIFMVLTGGYALLCMLMIYGTWTCKENFIYPYLFVDLIRLLLVFTALIVVMMLVKKNSLDLGLLIGASVCGGFVMLGLFYMWFSVLSLCQIIRQFKRETELEKVAEKIRSETRAQMRHISRRLDFGDDLDGFARMPVPFAYPMTKLQSIPRSDFQQRNLMSDYNT